MNKKNDFINNLDNLKQTIRNYIYLEEIKRFISRNNFFSDYYDDVFNYAISESTFNEIQKKHMKNYTELRQQNFNPDISDEATEAEDSCSEDCFSRDEYKFISENLIVTLVSGFIANLENQLKEVFKLLSKDIRDEGKRNQFIESVQNANISKLIDGLKNLNLINPQLSSIDTINFYNEIINIHKHGKGRAYERLIKMNPKALIQDQNDYPYARLFGKSPIKIEEQMLSEIKKAIDELWTDIELKNSENFLKSVN